MSNTERKGFNWKGFLNSSFWTGVFISIFAVLVSMFIGNIAYYSTHIAHKVESFWEKADQMEFFLDDYQKILKNECRNSDDTTDKILCFNLHRATERYLKEMSQCFDKATEMKGPIDQGRLKNFLDELQKERERRENKVKI